MVLTQHFGEHGKTRSRTDGRWVEAEIVSFGEHPVRTITLTRNGVQKTIRATGNHRWFASRRNGGQATPRELTTDELKPGMVLASLTTRFAPRLRWTVVSVEDHGEAEEVFCAVVPDTETFALEDYIWTHNCSQCRRPWEDVKDELCIAAQTSEHLRGGPIGERKKRAHHKHNCTLLGCVLPETTSEDDDGEADAGPTAQAV